MNRHGPDPQTAAELADQAGCSIADSTQLLDGSWAYRIECTDHRAKVRLLHLLAEYDSTLPDVRRLAELVVAGAPDTAEQVGRLQQFVQSRVTFTSEPGETFTATLRTLAHGLGDCDDSSRALMALVRSLGIPAKLAVLPDDPAATPLHVAAMAQLAGRWRWLEASIAAMPGEHPVAAARRLGITTRPELGALGAISPDEPEGLALHLTTGQWATLGAVTVAMLASMQYPTGGPVLTAIQTAAGGLAGHQLTTWPFVQEFEAQSGYKCETFWPPAEQEQHIEECNKAWRRLKIRNTALGAAAGLAFGLLQWKYRWRTPGV